MELGEWTVYFVQYERSYCDGWITVQSAFPSLEAAWKEADHYTHHHNVRVVRQTTTNKVV